MSLFAEDFRALPKTSVGAMAYAMVHDIWESSAFPLGLNFCALITGYLKTVPRQPWHLHEYPDWVILWLPPDH